MVSSNTSISIEKFLLFRLLVVIWMYYYCYYYVFGLYTSFKISATSIDCNRVCTLEPWNSVNSHGTCTSRSMLLKIIWCNTFLVKTVVNTWMIILSYLKSVLSIMIFAGIRIRLWFLIRTMNNFYRWKIELEKKLNRMIFCIHLFFLFSEFQTKIDITTVKWI